MSPIEILIALLLAAILLLQIVGVLKSRNGNGAAELTKLQADLQQQRQQQSERAERTERDLRNDIQNAGQATRQELGGNFAQFQQALATQLTSVSTLQNTRIDGFGQQLAKLNEANAQQLEAMRQAIMQQAQSGREEQAAAL